MKQLNALTVEQMTMADRLTIKAGTPGIDLMEAAGLACADVVRSTYSPRATLVVCGPGNNGGDGYIIARQLETAGWMVRVVQFCPIEELSGDAAIAAGRWHATTKSGRAHLIENADLGDAELIIDALFGTGISRDIDGSIASFIETINESDVPVLSVDIASGVEGNTGAIRGVAMEAEKTVAFCAPKQGHFLKPGCMYCGELIVADIGIPEEIIETVAPHSKGHLFENNPGLWEHLVPWPDPMAHKYDRGHTLVVGGPAYSTGASRLAAIGALRVGSGLVTIASPHGALAENAAHLTAIMLTPCEDAMALEHLLTDARLNTIVVGPGVGVGTETIKKVKKILSLKRAAVLDADALTSFSGTSEDLFGWIKGPTVLTPHWGEFCKLFGAPDKPEPNRIELVRDAARRSGAIVVLKGPDTLVANPAGDIAICNSAPPWLATAGSGDVLAGFIAGLLAQGMPPFEAACAAVWIHGEAANESGPGMISEDLPGMLPSVLSNLLLFGE
jgi:NAD(P)H-hydrate epimerase